jgi:3-hydroxyisobutyrate dehydrogenase-like beta-hydroxyacid dehydrogenase
MQTKIGFIGLGQMGKWMALNLLKAGHDMTVYDIDPGAIQFLRDPGAESSRSPADMAQQVETVFLSLPNTDIVEQVIFGDEGLIKGAKAGLQVVDLSTISYMRSLDFTRRLAEHKILFADAPVSGMEARAREGTLTIMFGGEKEVFSRLQPLLDILGSEVIYMGAAGSGQLMKLVNQILFNICAAGIAEVLPMAVKLGLDPQKVHRVVTTGTGRSFAADFFIPLTLEDCFDQGYPLNSAYKDMISAAEISAEQKIPLPLTQATATTFQMALAGGYGEESKGALIKVFEDILNVKFRKKER